MGSVPPLQDPVLLQNRATAGDREPVLLVLSGVSSGAAGCPERDGSRSQAGALLASFRRTGMHHLVILEGQIATAFQVLVVRGIEQ